jgi:hypothetical protein
MRCRRQSAPFLLLLPACGLVRKCPYVSMQGLELLVTVLLARNRQPPPTVAAGVSHAELAAELITLPSGLLAMVCEAIVKLKARLGGCLGVRRGASMHYSCENAGGRGGGGGGGSAFGSTGGPTVNYCIAAAAEMAAAAAAAATAEYHDWSTLSRLQELWHWHLRQAQPSNANLWHSLTSGTS